LEDAKAHLAARLGDPQAVEHDKPQLAIRGLKDDRNASLAAKLCETIRRLGGPGQCIGVPYGTDAPAFFPQGIPTVVFGPGSIEQAHTADEWVAIDQLNAATEIFYHFACEYGE
jgi:acetylornithine deacetylase